jgi:hypothetical protein
VNAINSEDASTGFPSLLVQRVCWRCIIVLNFK